MPKVSVIAPVHDAEVHLRQCLDSIVGQTFRDIEIICVDDGSTDRSGEILAEYAASDGRFVLITQEQQGVSAARNRGLDAASGEYVQFLDADDFFEPTLIQEVHERCVADDADVAVFPIRYIYEDGGGTVDASWSLRRDLLPDHLPFSATDMCGRIFRFVTPGVWNKMIRRSLIVERGLRFPPELKRAEDLPFTFFVLAVAARITVLDAFLINYRKHSGGSLQETLHETPTDICTSLVLLREELTQAGVFAQHEQDFVNAALHQCLYWLRSVSTAEAFRELYEALQGRYLQELGLSNRSRGYFYEGTDFDALEKIKRMTIAEYLFEGLLVAQGSLGEAQERRRKIKARLSKARKQLKGIQGSTSYRLGRRITRITRAVSRAPWGAGKSS